MREGWRERGRTHAKGHGDCTVLPFTSQEVAIEVFLSPKSPTVCIRKDSVGHSVCCLHQENRTGMCPGGSCYRGLCLLACLLAPNHQSRDNTQSVEGFAFK